MADEEVQPEEQQQEEQNQEAPKQEDLMHNLKKEFQRKQSNLEEKQAETQRQLEAILAEVQKSMAPKEAPRKAAKDLIYEDPEEYARQVREDAVREASEAVNRQYQASAAVTSAVNSLQAQYPEFAQDGSEAAKLAVEKASKLPAKLKGTAEGARLVMLETAAELGLVSASRRKTPVQQEEPVSGSRSTTTSQQSRKPSGKIDDKTKAFAELLGMDFNDPKQVGLLEKASTRKNWNRYE